MTLFVFIPTILCRYKCRFTVGRAHNVNGRGRGCEYIAAGSQPDHKGSRDRRCTCRLSFGCQSDNLLTTGWHAGLFCVYLTAGKKRFLRFSETCDYYNLGLVHIRTIVKNLAVDMGKTRIRILCCISSKNSGAYIRMPL